jgi:acetyl-CoA acetyltransferase
VIRREAAIAGIGQTAYAKALDATAWELAITAIEAACADAGVKVADVDGMCRFSAPFETVSEAMLVRSLGIGELKFFAQAPHGGEALGAVVAHAAAAVSAGLASVVVVYRALSQSKGGRFGRADRGAAGPAGDIVVPEQDNLSFAWPYGLMSPGQLFALWARRYAAAHKLTDEDLTRTLGTIAITQRQYANNNPDAMMRDRKLDWETYRNARMISEPLRLFDLCLENDGACAVVLTAADRAAAGPAVPVHVLSATQSLSPYREPMGIYTDDLIELFPPTASDRLFQRAGVSRSDISVAELYDACSFMTVKGLESYGFTEPGKGWRYVIEQGIGGRSPLPVNTHGGHLSEGYVHGMNGLTEAVRQLRGTARSQVSGAEVALVGAPSGSAVILAR